MRRLITTKFMFFLVIVLSIGIFSCRGKKKKNDDAASSEQAGAAGMAGGMGGVGGAGLPSYGLDVIPAFYGGGATGAGYSNSDGAGATSRNRKSRGYMAGGGVSCGGKDSRGGLANTGGGGGAQGNPSYKSGEGGTGIVVIQYELEVS